MSTELFSCQQLKLSGYEDGPGSRFKPTHSLTNYVPLGYLTTLHLSLPICGVGIIVYWFNK